ncbi:MAG TPA: hypothetical protein VFJ16_17225 [Longimicrobium sp.]|nr:hypothetical protein [Longimicrobium sp.]
MEIRGDILRRHMEEAAIEQLTAEYLGKGYSVVEPRENGGRDADLVVRRGDERIYFHVRYTPGSSESGDRLRRVHQHVQGDRNARLQLVVVRPPKLPEIDIENVEAQLLALCGERMDELSVSTLADHVRPLRVSDVVFHAVNVTRDGIEVEGAAGVEFEFKDAPADHCPSREAFPLRFHLVLDHTLAVTEARELDTDIGMPAPR